MKLNTAGTTMNTGSQLPFVTTLCDLSHLFHLHTFNAFLSHTLIKMVHTTQPGLKPSAIKKKTPHARRKESPLALRKRSKKKKLENYIYFGKSPSG